MFSKHCLQRLQQRSIPERDVAILLDFGVERRSHGAWLVYMNGSSREALSRSLGPGARQRTPMKNVYVVRADDGTILTAGHRTRRIRRS